jgi:enolase-phosphatase E1
MTAVVPRVYLLDVEGTVAPLTLTSELLFPYARAHLREFIVKHLAEDSVGLDLAQLAQERCSEADAEAPQCLGDGVESLDYLFWLMDRDRKSTALKSLQGKVWKMGFESGELKGALFADVPQALERWNEHARVAIYSSGSVEAQRLLFRYSTFGDLSGLIAANFDTRIGAKANAESYAAIAEAMQVKPEEVLFFSDVVRELDAAREAGCGTRLVVREGNAPVDDAHGHRMIPSFTDGV